MAGIVPRKILVIDDEEDHLTIIRATLERASYSVETSSSSHEALSKLRANRYDAIICDVWMEGITGLGFYQLVGERYWHRFLFVTANSGLGKSWEWISDKNVPYITKPFSPDDLLSKLDEVLGEDSSTATRTSGKKSDKRRERRLPVRTAVLVGRKKGETMSVETAPLIDLSRGGLSFLSDRQYELGERVTISFPSLDFNRLQHEGRVVRIDETPDGWRKVGVDIRERRAEMENDRRGKRDRRVQEQRQGLERRRM